MKLNIITPVVTSIMTLLFLSTQFAFADTVQSKDSVHISVKGFVEAETCKLIEAEMPDLNVDIGTISLAKLQAMRDGKETYGRLIVNRKVSFKCDGAAKKVNFTVKSNNPMCAISVPDSVNKSYLCNEAENGATVALAYAVNWIDPTGQKQDEVVIGTYDMNKVQGGKIDNGAFDFNLGTVFYGPYASHESVSPGEIKGHLLVTVWNS